MKKTLPQHFKKFLKKYPKVWEAHQALTEACAESGPLDRKTRELIKLAIAGAANQETAVERHAVMAVQEGAKKDEIYQTLLLMTTIVGFPRTSASLKWAERALTTGK
ncbi:MAG: carboxymuconolactone decarboxylase family protein [Candidatus Abyssobacteria bacterium SURF_17]|jgi:AhpD family alkylhydroperoxidase|uniref:Carboxymuconolactone decarboxylase family protein n=1 Tax=Candidatus Abyssobacteria bacterium SURF_17 TaxID=2093361 RepID=A0A419EMU0_9BACT|nr:MAG: carboxymuconolactone decarboxylase family protein [Candidatus Abyssubacteria bacterium SURF_17]